MNLETEGEFSKFLLQSVMSHIREFELFHGAVLTRLVRSDKPISLRMIETNPAEAWSAYTINTEVALYIKYSTKPNARKRQENSLVWTFSFGLSQLNELNKLGRQREVYIALVCGQRSFQDASMYICFMEPEDISRCIDLDSKETQTISVKYVPNSKLRVWGGMNSPKEPLLIANSKLEKWPVPGS